MARLAIGPADFWLQEDAGSSPESLDRQPVRMILTVADPDAVFEQAVAAGASEVAAVSEGHGWRIGRVADPFGHHWEIGRPLRRERPGGQAPCAPVLPPISVASPQPSMPAGTTKR